MSQLCLDNEKVSDYFVQQGLYREILRTFELLLMLHSEPPKEEAVTNTAECLKDLCIIIHGLSQSSVAFDFADPRLASVFSFLLTSNDRDIHYDVSMMLFNFTKTFASMRDWINRRAPLPCIMWLFLLTDNQENEVWVKT